MKHSADIVERWWPLLLVILGFSASLAAYAYLRGLEERALTADFTVESRDRLALIERTVDGAVEAVLSTADMLRVHPDTSRVEFERFGELVLPRQPSLSSLGYSRWTSLEETEAMLALLEAEGYPRAREVHRQASERGETEVGKHLVLTYLVPASLAPAVVGSNVISLPGRREAVLRARDEGRPRMTGPLELGGRSPEEAGVLVFAPVYRDPQIPETVEDRRLAFLGAVSIGLLIEPMLREVMPAPEDALLRTVVVDGGPEGVVLFDQVGLGPERLPTDLSAVAAHPLALWQQLEIAGRTWDVLTVPTPAFLQAQAPIVAPILVLVMGLLITLLAAGISVMRWRHARSMALSLKERETAAAELARTNQSLEAANQEMEEFVSAVSHDLRNPLQSIMMVSQQLALGVEPQDSAAGRRAIESLQRSAQAMARIVDGLLEHYSAGWAPLANERVDIAELVRRIASERADAIEQCGAAVEILDLPTIHGDPHRLATALDNLINNALKHSCSNGGGASIRIGSRDLDGEVHIYVSDNGPGIPQEHRERIFKLFQRMEGGSSGTGLGLAIVDRVARAHGGRAWVEDTPGGGATFVVALPAFTASG